MSDSEMSAAYDYAKSREFKGRRNVYKFKPKPKPKTVTLDAKCMQCGYKWMICTDEPEKERHCPKCGNGVTLTRS